MRLFWMAWGMALLLIAGAVAGGVWLISADETWLLSYRVGAWAIEVFILVFAFVGAYRLALLGTLALKHVLAQNLAIMIALELDDLRIEAQRRARVLDPEAASLQTSVQAAAQEFRIPRFLEDRAELRRLLGPATEQTLEELLRSLQSFNATMHDLGAPRKESDLVARHQTAALLRRELDVILERLERSMRSLAPFNRASVIQ